MKHIFYSILEFTVVLVYLILIALPFGLFYLSGLLNMNKVYNTFSMLMEKSMAVFIVILAWLLRKEGREEAADYVALTLERQKMRWEALKKWAMNENYNA